ncbi:ABC transporter permease [Demequina lignilytica]|uniref:ABC transporter permease n=1 Tax=Demequina lignilytica TaxID=3051663 RepID=A0AAW7M987_9MICO|nr:MULTISPECIES: ABC transporter permease [unclassified Demequina]MDN4477538.1 ABC transporter permease [Demequina sp. SYSU T00039-1]MDN4483583.1 ABC transporter permease [Demequina sp. SYSU T0a273]MDN4488111.1 ABC transporter permease [Demequina sp. SYSU T00039]MDN4490552.1 ABC transporter permease [Demequina sp. SYSU T00068]
MSSSPATLAPPASGGTRPRTRSRRARRSRDVWLGILGVLIVLVGAEILSRTGIVNPAFLPPVTEMYASLFQMLGEGWFWENLWLTVRGWAIGLAAAMALGIVVGFIIGSVPFLRAFTNSTIEFLRPIPSVALIPLVVLLFGTKPASAFLLVLYAAFWPVLVQVLYGVADVDPVARDTARSYQFGPLRIARSVIYPTALPYIMTAFRLAAAVALILEITAELVIGVPGLGKQIGIAQSSANVPETYALVIVVGLIGVAVNLMARFVERKALWWHSSVRGEHS